MDLWLGCGYGDTYNPPLNIYMSIKKICIENGRKKELAINNTRKEKGWSNHHEKKIAQSCEHAVIFGDNCDNCSSVTYGRGHFRNLRQNSNSSVHMCSPRTYLLCLCTLMLEITMAVSVCRKGFLKFAMSKTQSGDHFVMMVTSLSLPWCRE